MQGRKQLRVHPTDGSCTGGSRQRFPKSDATLIIHTHTHTPSKGPELTVWSEPLQGLAALLAQPQPVQDGDSIELGLQGQGSLDHLLVLNL